MSAVPLRSAVLFVALASVAAAQTNYGTITGTVQDPATSGFGRIDGSSVSGQRNGQIVARAEW